MTESNVGARRPDRRFLAFLACFYLAWCFRVVVLLPVDHRLDNELLKQCWSQGLRILLWIVPTMLYIRHVEGKLPLSFLRLDTVPRGRKLMTGVAAGFVFMLLVTIGACLFQGANLRALKPMQTGDWCLLLAMMSVVSVAEEIVFRGFVFRKLRDGRSFPRASIISSLLFVLIHWPGWLYMQGLHSGLLTLSFSIFLTGWVLALLTELTQSLWPPILLHLINNVWSSLLIWTP